MSVSLKTLAEAAGVSRTTVSLALRNHPRISESTRNRIQRIARQEGYHPNPDLRRLAADRGYRLDPFSWSGETTKAFQLDRVFNTRVIRGVFLHTARHEFPVSMIASERYCLCALGDRSGGVHRISDAGPGPEWTSTEALNLMDAMILRNETGIPEIPKRILPAEIPLETLAKTA